MLQIRAASVGLLMMFVLYPARADAIWGGLEWLDKLSGPGPFTGLSVNSRVLCFARQRRDDPWVVKPVWGRYPDRDAAIIAPPCRWVAPSEAEPEPYRFGYVDATVSVLWSKKNDLFGEARYDQPAQARAVTFRPGVMLRAYSWLDAGAAVGWYRFSGDAFESFTRFTIHPVRVTVSPFRGAARGLKFPVEVVYFKTRFEAADFGAPGNFVEQREFRMTVSAVWEY